MKSAMLASVLVSALAAGCSTPYQEMGFTGGVTAQQITASTFRIVARGNAYTGKTRVQDYALLKAAEVTKSNGATHFVVVSSEEASSVGYIATAGTSHTTFSGNTAHTTHTPGNVYSLFKPGEDLHIRILRPEDRLPGGAVAADEILQFVGSRVL